MRKREKETVMLKVRLNGKRKYLLYMVMSITVLILAGCSDKAPDGKAPEAPDVEIIPPNDEAYISDKNDCAYAEEIAEILSDIYTEAAGTNTLGSLDTMRRMVVRLGENGYAAIDSGNQVDMTGAEQVLAFCGAVKQKKNAEMTIIVITELGFREFDLKTENGKVNVVRGYYQYDRNGHLENRNTVSYPADLWQYTEEGYLIFEGNYFSDENYVLTLRLGRSGFL